MRVSFYWGLVLAASLGSRNKDSTLAIQIKVNDIDIPNVKPDINLSETNIEVPHILTNSPDDQGLAQNEA